MNKQEKPMPSPYMKCCNNTSDVSSLYSKYFVICLNINKTPIVHCTLTIYYAYPSRPPTINVLKQYLLFIFKFFLKIEYFVVSLNLLVQNNIFYSCNDGPTWDDAKSADVASFSYHPFFIFSADKYGIIHYLLIIPFNVKLFKVNI